MEYPSLVSFGSACLTAIKDITSLFVTKESYVGKLGLLGKESETEDQTQRVKYNSLLSLWC